MRTVHRHCFSEDFEAVVRHRRFLSRQEELYRLQSSLRRVSFAALVGNRIVSHSVLVQLEWPNDWKSFRLPPVLQDRLQELLDRQDREGKLSRRERREATALTQLVDLLSLMRLRSELAARSDRP